MTNFYILENRDFRTEKGFADTEFMRGGKLLESLSDDVPTCPSCGEDVSGRVWIPPYKIELEMYTKWFGNVVLGTGGKELVVDDYFKNSYEATGMTGLEFLGEAVITKIICRWEVKKKQLGKPPKYYVMRIKYGCAAIDHEKSGSVFEIGEKPTCKYCRMGGIMRYRQIAIDESTWDGTDIFLARGIGSAITTSQRFKDWWDLCNFNNCKVIPAQEASWDSAPGVSPEEYAYKSEHGWNAPWPPAEE